MKNEQISLAKLKLRLEEQTRALGQAESHVADNNSKMVLLKEKCASAKANLQEKQRAVWDTHERILVLSKLPPKLVALRKQYIKLREKFASIDITIRQKGVLEMRIENVLKKLQAKCDHRFVFSYDGHRGFQSEDYNDAYEGHHRCLICGLKEKSKKCGVDEYEILTNGSYWERLIKRDLRKRERLQFFEDFPLLPISYIYEIFLNSVGNMNARWPKGNEFDEVLSKKTKPEHASI